MLHNPFVPGCHKFFGEGILSTKRIESVIAIPLMLLVIYLAYTSGPSWDSVQGAAAMYSALAFLCVAMTVALNNLGRVEETPAIAVLTGMTTSAFLIFGGSSIVNVLSIAGVAIHTYTEGIFLNLVSMVAAGVLVLIYALLGNRQFGHSTIWNPKRVEVVVAALAIMWSGGFTLLIAVHAVPQDALIVAGRVMGLIAVGSLGLASAIMFSRENGAGAVDSFRLGVAFAFMAAASAMHTYMLPSPIGLWILSMSCVGIGFVYAVMGIATPYLISIGVGHRRAYVFSLGICLLVALPFASTYILVEQLGFQIIIHVSAAMHAHLVGAFIAAAAAYLMYTRTKTVLAPWHQPTTLLLLFWAVAELFVGLSPLTPLYTDSISVVPYVTGSSVATILLATAYRRTLTPHTAEVELWSAAKYALLVSAFVFLLGLSEFLRVVFLETVGGTFQSALAEAIMLAFSLFSLFALLNLFLGLAAFYGGRLNIDTNIAALLALWVIVVILRAIFPIWTFGWWASELVLCVGSIVYAVYVLGTHAQEVNSKTQLQKRLLIHKRLLMPELLAKITSVSDTVERLTTEKTDDACLKVISQILGDLSRVQSLAESIRIVLSHEPVPWDSLTDIDLIDLLRAVITPSAFGCRPTFETEFETCLVRSNRLLAEAVRSVLQLVVERIGHIAVVTVETIRAGEKNDGLCGVRVILDVDTENAMQKHEMLLRYATGMTFEATELSYAKMIVANLRGEITFSFEVKDDKRLLVMYDLLLPAVKSSGWQSREGK